VIVVSVYMLLDFGRLGRAIDRRFPPQPGSEPLLPRVETAVAGYVKGQALVSLIIGASAGLGMWVLGVTGLVPGADKYALLFGAWVALTELVPYLGPWLGAIPAGIYAAVVHPISLLWVTALFLVIHQIEGHIVVANSAVKAPGVITTVRGRAVGGPSFFRLTLANRRYHSTDRIAGHWLALAALTALGLVLWRTLAAARAGRRPPAADAGPASAPRPLGSALVTSGPAAPAP